MLHAKFQDHRILVLEKIFEGFYHNYMDVAAILVM